MTDAELEAATKRSHQSVSSARNALVNDEYVEAARDDAGQPIARPTNSGRLATAWQITELGRALAGAA